MFCFTPFTEKLPLILHSLKLSRSLIATVYLGYSHFIPLSPCHYCLLNKSSILVDYLSNNLCEIINLTTILSSLAQAGKIQGVLKYYTKDNDKNYVGLETGSLITLYDYSLK